MTFDPMLVITLILVGIAMVPAVAHAFEFPGKKRLNRNAYVTVQGIYYPGFTLLGASEPAAILSTFLLLLLTPRATTAFWLVFLAFICVLDMQVIYWTFIHPANKYWLNAGSLNPRGAGGAFFAMGSPEDQGGMEGAERNWLRFRDRWEYSHIARAGLAFLSFVALVLVAVGQR